MKPVHQSQLSSLIVGIRVRSQDASKPIIYSIKKLAKPAVSQKFTLKKENQETTVENYYKKQYNVDLKYIPILHSHVPLHWTCISSRFPQLPTLEMSNGAYLPMELVDTEPMRMKKITDDQRAAICRQATIKPVDYQRSIQNIRRNPEQQKCEDDPFIRAWQMDVDVEMITVLARVLPMPDIVYTKQFRVTATKARQPGVWELTAGQFYEPKNFPSVWAMINLSHLRQDECEEFYMGLRDVARHRGMDCPDPAVYEEMDARSRSMEQIASSLRIMMERNRDCQFFVVILPRDGDLEKYAYITLKKLVNKLRVVQVDAYAV